MIFVFQILKDHIIVLTRLIQIHHCNILQFSMFGCECVVLSPRRCFSHIMTSLIAAILVPWSFMASEEGSLKVLFGDHHFKSFIDHKEAIEVILYPRFSFHLLCFEDRFYTLFSSKPKSFAVENTALYLFSHLRQNNILTPFVPPCIYLCLYNQLPPCLRLSNSFVTRGNKKT